MVNFIQIGNTKIKISQETADEMKKKFSPRRRFYGGEVIVTNGGTKYMLGLDSDFCLLVNTADGISKDGFYRKIPMLYDKEKEICYVESLPTMFPTDFGLDSSYKGDK